jgi:hypothetical protein
LFPEGCFEDQLYDNSATHWPYENYAAGNNFPGPSSSQASAKDKGKSDPKAKGTLMRVLRRGRNAAVDTLLDWLVSIPVQHFHGSSAFEISDYEHRKRVRSKL